MDTLFSKFSSLDQWLQNVLVFIALTLLGLFVQWLIFKLLKLDNKRKPTVFKEQLLLRLKIPSKFLIPLLFVYSTQSLLQLSIFWKTFIETFMIINFTWIVIALLQGLEKVVKEKFEVEGSHDAKDRKVLTQLRFIKNITLVVIITIAVASILWNIPAVKKIGSTILTSAGVIGIIAGIAAQKSIANLITGFQIAFTQPIKIDDQVAIEGEFGTVEDITLTYVVIKTWDWRRLVLPLNYFNDKPFVNWTFTSTKLIGTVFLYVDYSLPVSELRTKLLTLLKENPLWDKNIAELLVTNTTNDTMELRATFSAKNASNVWNLRCSIREQLISYINDTYPESLPQLRQIQMQKI